MNKKLIAKLILIFSGLYLSAKYEFIVLYIVIVGVYLIFTNLDDKKREGLSAYSVFNKNNE